MSDPPRTEQPRAAKGRTDQTRAEKGRTEKANLRDKFGRFTETWSPKIVAQVNDTQVKLAKLEGEFEWHHHEEADELFLVHSGRLLLQFRDREDVWLEPGELLVVPRGVEHRPVAPEPVELVLIERAGTRNTGNLESERTVEAEWI